MTKPKKKALPRRKEPEIEFVECEHCGHEQADMGRNVACEECGEGPMPTEE